MQWWRINKWKERIGNKTRSGIRMKKEIWDWVWVEAEAEVKV